jgi:thiol-disulfide isomerase/thioredoxin
MTETPDRPRRSAKGLVLVALGIGAGVAAGFAGVYGIDGLTRNAGDPACQPAVETAQRIAPLAKGEVAAVGVATTGRKLPDLAFKDEAGQARTLADWRGKTVLFNLWATWCVPCRKEMPALAELQANAGGPAFEVVAVNIDTRDPQKPKAWLKEVGLGSDKLGYFADSSAKVFQDLKEIGKAFGMPTTLLIDPQGCEIATLAGPAEWASEDALRLIRAALEKRTAAR